MLNLNRIEIIGNLTRDPEMRYTATSQSIASFAVATNRRYRDQAGNWVDAPPEYHNIIVWGALGESCGKVLHKGDRIYVSGRQQTSSWDGNDGLKHYKTELVADTIIGPDTVNRNLGTGSFSNQGEFNSGSDTSEMLEPSPTLIHTDSTISTSKPSKGKKSTSSLGENTSEEINIDDIPF
jgi:single-strand DNA-binding protein